MKKESPPNKLNNSSKNIIIIVGLFIMSLLIQLYINDLQLVKSGGQAFFQLITSWLFSFVAMRFAPRYKDVTQVKWWIRLYSIMVIATLFGILFFKDEYLQMVNH